MTILKKVILTLLGIIMIAGLAYTGLLVWGDYKAKIAAEEAKREAEVAAKEAVRAAKAALDACDTAASHPSDPNRYAAPTPDNQIALGTAASACELAVRLNPSIEPHTSRLIFQLGRVYRLQGKHDEAFAKFVDADKNGYTAASKFIGDAFFDGKGLPPSYKINPEEALAWYRKAQKGGYTDAGDAISTVESFIRRSRFDRSKFQYHDYMTALYENTFDRFEAPVALAYYTQGLVKVLDGEPALFLDQKCKPLLNIIGNKIIDNAHVIAVFKQLAESGQKSAEENIKRFLRTTWDTYVAKDIYFDYGKRDGIVLFDKEIYGCDSPVTQQIVKNIMVRIDTGRR
jgi:hypothetical protein